MINPVERGGFRNFEKTLRVRKQRNEKKLKSGGVVLEISTSLEVSEEKITDKRLEELKKLIKEGNYPLDRQKLAEKIVNFLLDGE